MKKTLIILAALLVSCGTKEVAWDATGTFEATEVTVSAEGIGNILSLDLTDGQKVSRNEVVGQIDTTQLNFNKLQLIASRGGAMSRHQDVAKQIAATQQQIEWQSSEKKRFEKLASRNAATQKQIDDFTNSIAVLQKQLSAQRSILESANTGVSSESLAISTQIELLNYQLSKCKIKSPIDGTVLVRYAEAGEYAVIGKPLFTVADIDNMYMRAYITADQLTRMKLGQKVKVYSDFGAKEQREYEGTVEWIASRGEFTPKSIQTRNERASMVYAVKIGIKNDGYLKIGMYGQVVIND